VRNAVTENEAVFKCLQAAVSPTAKERGIAEKGLHGEMFAYAQIIEDFWDGFGVFADRRIDGNADFQRGTQRGVKTTIGETN